MNIKKLILFLILILNLISLSFGYGFHEAYEVYNGTFDSGKYVFPNDVVINSNLSTPKICLNGDCQTSWPNNGDITAVNAGTGLTGGGSSGDVTLNVDTSSLQLRVNSTCPSGSSIRVIYENGSVDCEIDSDTNSGGTIDGSGSSGYLPYFSASSTLANSNIYYDGSKVGIGVVPFGSFDFVTRVGTNKLMGFIEDSDGGVLLATNDSGSGINLKLQSPTIDFVTNSQSRLYIDNSGNVGIGTSNPNELLVVGDDLGSLTSSNAFVIGNTVGSSVIYMGEDDENYGMILWDAANDVYKIQSRVNNTIGIDTFVINNGNIGIGTATPQRLLHLSNINPQLAFEESDQGSNLKNWAISANNQALQFVTRNDDWSSDSTLLHFARSGNIGLNEVTNPNYALDLYGEIAIRGAQNPDDARIHFQANDESNRFTIETDLNSSTPFDTLSFSGYSVEDILVLKGDGNVGIGTLLPNESLHVIGRAQFNNGGTNFVIQPSAGTTQIGSITAGADLELIAGTGTDVTIDGTTGYVGIGTSNPNEILVLSDDSRNTGMEFGLETNEAKIIGWYAGNNSWNDLDIRTTSTPQLFLKTSGNVGIGTDTPLQTLSVIAGATDYAILNVGKEGDHYGSWMGGSQDNNPHVLVGDWYTAGGGITWNSTTDDLLIDTYASGQNILLANVGGNVGIGTTSPLSDLDVYKTKTGNTIISVGNAVVSGNDGAKFQLRYGSTQIGALGYNWTGSSFENILDFYDRLKITRQGVNVAYFSLINGGSLGIGTTAPSGTLKLDVEGQVGATQYCDELGLNCIDIANVGTGTVSGTANYVPKFTDTTTIGNSIIYDSGSNIGIGLTNPSHKLDVAGSAQVSGNLNIVTTGDAITLDGAPPTVHTLRIDNAPFRIWSGDGASEIIRFDNETGNIGVGISTPDDKLEVTGNISIQNGYGFKVGGVGDTFVGQLRNAAGVLELKTESTRDIQFSGESGGTSMYIDTSEGDIGIGTNMPETKFQIIDTQDAALSGDGILTIGAENTQNLVFDQNEIMSRNNGSKAILYLQTEGGDLYVHNTGSLVVKDSGNVGIGTTTPQDDFHVAAQILTGSTGNNGQLAFARTSDGQVTGQIGIGVDAGDGGDLTFSKGGGGAHLRFNVDTSNGLTERMRIDSDGLVGIGTTNPSEELHINKTIQPKLVIEAGASSNPEIILKGGGAYGTIINQNLAGTTTGRLGRYLGYMTLFNGAGESGISVDGSGNVGIGILDAQTKLDIRNTYSSFKVGDIQTIHESNGTSALSDFLIIDDDNNNSRAALQVQGNGGSNEVLFAASNGNVGIGTILPDGKLDVNDGTYQIVAGGGTTGLMVQGAGDNAEGVTQYSAALSVLPSTTSEIGLRIQGRTSHTADLFQIEDQATSPRELFVVDASGDVGIGTGNADGVIPSGWNNNVNSTILGIQSQGSPYDAGISLSRKDSNNIGTDYWLDGGTGDVFFDQRWESSAGDFIFRTNTTSTPQTRFVIQGDGDIGIGASNPDVALQIGQSGISNNDTTIKLYSGDGVGSNAFRITYFKDTSPATDRLAFRDGGNKEVLTLENGGNVGIGTTNPNSMFEINNGGSWSGGVSDELAIGDNNGYWGFNAGTNLIINDDGTTRFVIDSSGNVGIGATPNSNNNLHIHDSTTGSFMMFSDSNTGSSNFDGFIIGVDNTKAYIDNREATSISFRTSATERMVLDSSGNLGIGTSSPNETLHVAGNLQVDDNVTATDYFYLSDERLKDNIKTLDNSLDKIIQLNGVSFDWKKSGQSKIGLIAQEVEEVYPELVKEGKDGYKSVQYANLIAPLIEAVKDQQEIIENQQKQIDELRNLIENE